jgi:hypothetical protein
MSRVTLQRLLEVLEYCPDTGHFTWRTRTGGSWQARRFNKLFAGKRAGFPSRANLPGGGYWSIQIDGKENKAHRLAWLYYYGTWPVGEIDHINHCGRDNRIVNLRSVTHGDNMLNKRRYQNNGSGITGVSRHKKNGTWVAYFNKGGKRQYLGSFPTREDAAIARQEAILSSGLHPNHGQ